MIHQTSWKCCVFLYLGFTAMLPNHLLNATVLHYLHLFVGKDQSPLEFWVHSQVSWDVEFCEPDVTASFPPHYPYHVCCRNMHVSIFFSEFRPPHHTATQNSVSTKTQILDKTVQQQETIHATALSACFTRMSVLCYTLCYKWPTKHTP